MDELYEQFDSILDDKEATTVTLSKWVNNTRKLRGETVDNRFCNDCNKEYIITTNGATVCPECGVMLHYSLESEYIKKTQAYKRMTHFKDWLIKTQAKHNPSIPSSVYDDCRRLDVITYDTVKALLKETKNTKYYEDIWFIISVCDPHAKIFTVSSYEESLLCGLFYKVQQAWETIKPIKRKSIISYPFIISELLLIIKRPDLKCFFRLPRYNKILDYYTIWKRIMSSSVFYSLFSKD
jgi:hypothetical protein